MVHQRHPLRALASRLSTLQHHDVTPLPILRLTQLLLTILTLSLLSSLAAHINSSTFRIATPSSLNFAIFTSLYTLLVIIPYTTLAPRWFPRWTNRYVMVGAEGSCAVFWFGAVVGVGNWVRKETGRGRVLDGASEVAKGKGVAIAGVVFAGGLFILFTTTAFFALSHLLSSRHGSTPTHPFTSQPNQIPHHQPKASASSITKLLPTHHTHHQHSTNSPTDPPYKRTQYRTPHQGARPLSWRSFKSVTAASKARSRNHFILMREREAQEAEEERQKWGCGLGVGQGSGRRAKEEENERVWRQMEKPNLVVVPPRGNGMGMGRSPYPWGGVSRQQQVEVRARPYSTRVVAAAGKVWERAREVGISAGSRLSAWSGGGNGGHAGWFGGAGGRREGDGSRGGEGWSRIGIGNPGGSARRWDGADVV